LKKIFKNKTTGHQRKFFSILFNSPLQNFKSNGNFGVFGTIWSLGRLGVWDDLEFGATWSNPHTRKNNCPWGII